MLGASEVGLCCPLFLASEAHSERGSADSIVTLYSPPADREFIEGRRRALKRFINLVARHPPFSEDVLLKIFLSFSGSVSVSLSVLTWVEFWGLKLLLYSILCLRPVCTLRLAQLWITPEAIILSQPLQCWEPIPGFYSLTLCFSSCLLFLV